MIKTQRKTNYLIIAISLVVLFGVIVATSLQTNAAKINKKVITHFDLTESFDSIESLEQSASLIANVKVNSSKSFTYGNVVFTLSNVSVNKAYKGEADKTINILETGGIGEDGLYYTVEGNDVLLKNQQAIVYLEKYDGPIAENAYVIKGVYEGKFKIQNGKLLPPKETKGDIQHVNSINDLNLE
ncbi:hypothetical protein PASE110613_00100 [Paenibacillus sediminis]|uniref:Uncharacterized protein n=1 Tax=Paenibacillus sediminis TaxID=664909 RepID=A0ABS4H0H9_9BACL|nr:hypothetical protein [Paenibacillus sediminis]MBP1936019.1 hypothetical protein [Paenibacillus sediminis]